MPDVSISGIEYEIKGSADGASKSIDNLTNRLKALNSTLSQTKSIGKLSVQMGQIGKAAKTSAKGTNQFFNSVARIAKYRLIRSAIKAITQAFSEGLKNAYQFSKGIGGDLAKALDGLSTKGMTMKNQLGAAFGGLLTAITPIIQSIISIVTKLATALSMLFGLLGGSGKYLKAKDVWTEWGEAAAGAGGAAKKALEYLAPFDELNVLPDQNSGGGGGGSSANYGDMFSQETIGGWGDLASNISQFVVNAFSSASEWIKNVDWEELGRNVVRSLVDFFTNLDYSGIARSISGFLGRAVGAAAQFTGGLLSELNNLCNKIVSHIIAELKKDRNGDGKLTLDEIFKNVIDVALAPLKWIKENIVDPFIEGFTDQLLGEPFSSDDVIEWFRTGIKDCLNEAVRFFTGGYSAEEIVAAIEDTWTIVEAWFQDLPAQFKNLGIRAINGLKQGMENGLNALIDAINNSGFAQFFGLHFDPVSFELLPEIPESELHAHYNAAKEAIEEAAQNNPPSVPIDIAPPDENGPTFTLTVDTTANITSVKTPGTITMNSIANITDWRIKGTKDESVVKSFNTWASTANFNDWKVYGTKNTNANGFTTWASTANFNKYTYDTSKVQTDGSNIKLNATANITRAVGRTTVSLVAQAEGGVFKNGAWSSIPQYASGTANAHGSLFVAGEAGPEVVGHIGGRTEVLNRSQLAATMYSAVVSALSSLQLVVTAPSATNPSTGDNEETLYRAFRRALDETDFGGDMELDGDVIYRSVVRRNRQNTRATGVNQLALA